jgi:20S proteasome alpha/beta subunit
VAESRTLVVGFRCNDGVILGADSQLTVPNWFKYPESKLRYFKGRTYRAFFGYAGDVDFSKMCIHDLTNKLRQVDQKDDSIDLRELLKDEAQRIYVRYYAADDPTSILNLLIAFQQSGKKCVLTKILGKDVVTCPTYEFLGTGEHLARAIGGSRYRSRMSMKEVLPIAVFTLAEAKEHVYGVSGNSQLILIHDIKDDVNVVQQSSIEEMEKAYAEFNSASREFLIQYCDLQVKDEAFNAAMETYTRRLALYRNRVFRYRRYMEKEAGERQAEYYSLNEEPLDQSEGEEEEETGD